MRRKYGFFSGVLTWNICIGNHANTPDSSVKPAGCAAPEDLERIAGIGPKEERERERKRMVPFPNSIYIWCMKHFLLFISVIYCTLTAVAQETRKSKIYMKNGDVITARILGLKADVAFTIEMSINVEVDIPLTDIDYIVMDANNSKVYLTSPTANHSQKSELSEKQERTLGDFYFESVNEGVVSLGVGKIGGFTMDTPLFDQWGGIYGYDKQTVPNTSSFGGVYTANGIGYKKWGFAGIGIGGMGYSDNIGFSVPFMLDLRARILPAKKISPLVMVSTGIAYHKGSVGSFDFNDGAGVSIQLKNQINIHALLAHSYMRYYGRLSASGATVLDGVYYNYFGIRLGASFRF